MVIFETFNGCNLASLHTKCPVASPLRWQGANTNQAMTDEKIIETAIRLRKEFNFNGFFAFHYFNEPSLAHNRNVKLINAINSEIKSKFLLWTNGMFLHKLSIEEINLFDKIFISVYNQLNLDVLKNYKGELNWRGSELDDRMNPPTEISERPCLRMFTEMIFDFFGNQKLCCMAWQGKMSVGNLMTDKLEFLVERWINIRETMLVKMEKNAPDVCQSCGKRWDSLTNIEPSIQKLAQEYIDNKRQGI